MSFTTGIYHRISWLLLLGTCFVPGISYAWPSPSATDPNSTLDGGVAHPSSYDISHSYLESYGNGYHTRAVLDPCPLGISMESKYFPRYFSQPSTHICLSHIGRAFGRLPPLRIGGSTADQSRYDPSQNLPVSDKGNGTWALGPPFFELAASYGSDVIIGLNRKFDDFDNTALAAVSALRQYNLSLVELGNEPDMYKRIDPIIVQQQNNTSWTPSSDQSSQTTWQLALASKISNDAYDGASAPPFVLAGSYASGQNGWVNEHLSAAENKAGASQYVKAFSLHGYFASGCSGSKPANLIALMSHAETVRWARARYADDARATRENVPGAEYWIGETNSISCGGGGISSSFGAALWVMNYALQASLIGASKIFFHQGGLDCKYCWFSKNHTYAPFYGAYMASLALGGSHQIRMLDDGSTNYAAYHLSALPSSRSSGKLLLYNSDYYDSDTGDERRYHIFKISGIATDSSCARGIRMSANSAKATVEGGDSSVNVGGVAFENGSCNIVGEIEWETFHIRNGEVAFKVMATEALLVYLDCDNYL